MEFKNSKNIYFASDVHLGLQVDSESRDKHDMFFISWLDTISKDAEKIYLLGDIFDFWFENRNNIPNYYGKVLSKLRELICSGIEIHFFVGNHDMWTNGYLENQIGLIIHHAPERFVINGKVVVMGHGHNLRINEPFIVKAMNTIFNNKMVYKTATLFIHADLMMWFGRKWSRASRHNKNITHDFRGENEFITIFCNRYLVQDSRVDYFIFGHLHCPTIYPLVGSNSKLFILGEWIQNPTYGVLNPNGELILKQY